MTGIKARDIYRYAKMSATAVAASIGYILVECPEMPHYWRIGFGALLAAMGAVGLYVTPSPIHQSDLPVPVPADVVGPVAAPAEPGGV